MAPCLRGIPRGDSPVVASCSRSTSAKPPIQKSHALSHIPNRHHRTNPTPPDRISVILGPNRHHRTIPTDCIHLIIPRSWVRSPPALPGVLNHIDSTILMRDWHYLSFLCSAP